ncbi:MAG TPA: hypothetical protein VJH87_21445 [Vicinamibacteria bacterium]|nr:hypothetical protein [Vicinamibacteria bacterium]
MVVQPGAVLGRYKVESLIGRGGMGEVYRARDTSLGREVAIKALPAALATDPERLSRVRVGGLPGVHRRPLRRERAMNGSGRLISSSRPRAAGSLRR